MKAKKLIEELQRLTKNHGDEVDVVVYKNSEHNPGSASGIEEGGLWRNTSGPSKAQVYIEI
jgi:hypothetical protein